MKNNTSKTTPASSRWLLSLLALITASSFSSAADQGNGYVFYKEQGFHPDSKALVKVVVSYESSPTISRAKTKNGNLFEITSGQSPVFLPDPNGPASPYAVVDQIKELIVKYPQHKVLLEKLLAVSSTKKAEADAAANTSTKQPEYSVVLIDGRKIQNAQISNITDESFTLTSELSIERIKYESVDLSLSKLPAGLVKAAEAAKKRPSSNN